MSLISCPHEARVARAAQTGCRDDFAKAHIAECPHCREIAEIAGYLGSVARAGENGHALPEAEKVWLNARIQMIQTARERALRPVVIAELVFRAALILALSGGMALIWSRVQSLAIGWPTKHAQIVHGLSFRAPAWLAPVAQPAFLCLSALGVCLLALAFIKLLQPILIEE